jgi:hypothetical protein
MPLSEQEQRLLDEMERNLYQNDADFVAKVAGQRAKPNTRTVLLGVLVVVIGVAALVTGVIIRQPVVGVLGFAVMFAGVMLAIAPPRRLAAAGAQSRARSSKPRRSANSGPFMDNLNERWDRRRDEREF